MLPIYMIFFSAAGLVYLTGIMCNPFFVTTFFILMSAMVANMTILLKKLRFYPNPFSLEERS